MPRGRARVRIWLQPQVQRDVVARRMDALTSSRSQTARFRVQGVHGLGLRASGFQGVVRGFSALNNPAMLMDSYVATGGIV